MKKTILYAVFTLVPLYLSAQGKDFDVAIDNFYYNRPDKKLEIVLINRTDTRIVMDNDNTNTGSSFLLYFLDQNKEPVYVEDLCFGRKRYILVPARNSKRLTMTVENFVKNTKRESEIKYFQFKFYIQYFDSKTKTTVYFTKDSPVMVY